MTDQEPIAQAILAQINASLPASVRAYDRDDVPGLSGNPGEVPDRWVTITLYRHGTDGDRLGGYNLPGFFLDTTYRAPSIQNCRELRRLTGLALEGQLVGDFGVKFNDETQPIDDDPDGGFSAVDTWQFC